MGKKKRSYPDIEEVLSRPWCYYCERDFEDLKLLISHQKAKHFKCDRCGRRLNTAGGLSVHMNQVHKEALNQVENALPNRQGLDVEIFGMEGIPQETLEQHRTRIVQNFYQAQEDRRIATGNPQPGQAKPPRKKVKMETPEELKKRLAEHKAKVAAAKAAGVSGSPVAGAAPLSVSPGAINNSPYPPPQVPYGTAPTDQQFPAAAAAAAGVAVPPGAQPYTQQPYPAGGYPGYPATAAASLPTRTPGSVEPASGLPQRPSYGNGAAGGAVGDEIDQLIRMAESGVRPARKPEEGEGAATEKKSKKGGRMVYSDDNVSPEERIAQLSRYAWVPPVS
ncbi:hypothetical protein SODALDRAFT_331759 [Sodiomyces alkalinus F11]|uniref:C2H2-type domain-containing protein n=1 Tax=Sodiomyces alkalinus (strain CBS 110278 / VKM F-3762 / F11) TaxID=1314773 RepID=A0A3N2PYP4_SODAK|nr:hypothetical protein SODALDRAFT_331759 [Sodiomyces alkalinus F11]ROT39649.1 hypothetical protein SODALDRAFT_331759 [Sodiomyces alkalinus F11]